MKSLTFKYIIFAIAAVLLVSLYYVFDPAVTRWAPKCMFHVVTGLDCPGCGSQRMLHALLHGDFASAWNANPFIICISPVIAVMAFAATFRTRHPRLYAIVNSLPMIIAVGAALIAWTILRNL